MHRHREGVGQFLRAIDAGLVLEIEVDVRRGVVVEIVATRITRSIDGRSALIVSRAATRRSVVLKIDSVSSGLPSGPL